MLGNGLVALAAHTGATISSRAGEWAQLVLWNTGTLTVAAADLASAPGGVLAGSGLLLAAPALFAVELRQVHRSARRPARRWSAAYVLLLAGLVASIITGTALAGALPS